MNKTIVVFLAFLFSISSLFADEGMWLPMLLKKYNIEDMQNKGFKLTAEDIYSVNNACMKDAVVMFGRGCTAELISDEGLIITNHHCGYSRIQSHSSVENDYLTDGFWAMNKEEELTNPGLTVTFLVRMEDVSEKILANVKDDMTEEDRSAEIKKAISKTKKEALDGNDYTAEIKPFYYGNEYYMFVYETYKDVRLVGAPPSSIGKFGGDTDNWMWPRHTGDFSLFRIYADKDNKPAKYSKDNVPYKPKQHFPISLEGVKKDDFTMVFGYPASTEQFLTSYAVDQIINEINPARIKIRDKKLAILDKYMDNDTIRIQYSSKYAGIANSWKKWKGIIRGLDRLNAVERKKELEARFKKWYNKDDKRKQEYGELLETYKSLYESNLEYQKTFDYLVEILFYNDIYKFSSNFMKFPDYDKEKDYKDLLESTRKRAKGFFKDYTYRVDRELFMELVNLYYNDIDKKFQPESFAVIEKKYDGNAREYAGEIFKESRITSQKKFDELMSEKSKKIFKAVDEDPVVKFFSDLLGVFLSKIRPQYGAHFQKVNKLNRIYVKGLKEMQSEKIFYPDANFTLRVAYGNIKDYYPRDGIHYAYYTTLKGVIEKVDPNIYDYDVPQKIIDLYNEKDYGPYGEDGEMHVCFIATNHTSGGNSGSPVINAEGELIGVNFDRNWEGTMSDIMYDPSMCRNITLDIRYALFVIDKFAGAGHLVKEMTITDAKSSKKKEQKIKKRKAKSIYMQKKPEHVE